MKTYKPLQFIIIFLVIIAWLFSGFPRIWQNPPVPPEIQEARADTQEFTLTDTWTAPSGVTSVDVECWGGGGGGGNGATKQAGGGGGGGGGGYVKKLAIPITALNNYTVTVGAGGGSITAGENSSFTGDSSVTITANGGNAGGNNGGSGGNGGGGSCTGGCGTGPYTGGDGAVGTVGDNGPGGGGGGSGGTGGNGNSATSQTGASAVTGGGPGGNGGAENNNGSVPASGYGGGGGGAGNKSGATKVGGSGYGGKCVLTWTPATETVSCSTEPAQTGFETLTIDSIFTATSTATTTMSCTYGTGCTLYIKDAGDIANPGLYSAGASDLINSSAATLSAGVEGYGIQAATTTAGTGVELLIDAAYKKTGDDVGAFALTGQTLTSAASTFDSKETVVTFKAAISGLNKAGNYTDTITFECTGN